MAPTKAELKAARRKVVDLELELDRAREDLTQLEAESGEPAPDPAPTPDPADPPKKDFFDE